ncbi:MAG TPA: hypothetical protein IGS17_15430 [Oscillatoriales cyanobacterium M59_W2019_021]|nr:MAG: hypothetical protein D6728_01725 [Cyanobacteria bacterium J055]HIK32239.1 hypothetical protein [Oscillatoriales cyanobacterium M4454_W2019_049]HIK52298.1 hypothetical protein [Oscillatoriales cyanobacterium M59_W2019_021]
MRILQFWWQTLRVSAQHNPPQFIEIVMLVLAAMLMFVWLITQQWPYLVLGAGYTLGSAASIWVRESIAPYPHRRLFHASIVLILTVILFGLSLVDLLPL